MPRDMRREPARDLPSAVDAEQAVLGAILYDNAAYHRLPEGFGLEHFSEPFHQRMFTRIRAAVDRGDRIDAVVLGSSAFSADPAYADLGGMTYLAELIDRAPPTENVPSYAAALMEVSVRRELVKWAREIEERAYEETADKLITTTESVLADLRTGTETRFDDSDDAMDRVLDWIDNPGNHPSGILTGLAPLDDHLGPWLPGDLIVDGGRPGSGKSAKAAIITRNVAQQGFGAIEIHAEMSVEQVWRRRLTATAYEMFAQRAPNYSAIRKRTIEYDQREVLGAARERLRGLPLKAVKRTGLTLSRINAMVMRQKAAWAKQGIVLGLVSIDHVGLIKTDRQYDNRVAEQTEISGGLKRLAGEWGCPVLALAQLSRQVESREDKRPTLSDLRDSGSWEQDADMVFGTYRESYYAQREQEPKRTTTKEQADWASWDQRCRSPWMENLFLKVREGEAGKTAKLWAHMGTNTILGEAPQDDSIFGGL